MTGDIERGIRITGTGSALQGVGRAADGRTLFVHNALPGELADVRITKDGGRFLAGEAMQILEPSPERTQPRCPHHGRCGGCAALHMRYELSLRLKTQKVRDAMARIGKTDSAPVMDALPSPSVERYRNKAEYACRGGAFGATVRAGRDVIDIDDCLLQHESSAAFLRAARGLFANERALGGIVTRVNGDGALMGILCIHHARHIARMADAADALFAQVPALRSLYVCELSARPTHALDGACRLVRGDARLDERLCGLSYRLSPHTFFQVNRDQAEALVGRLLAALALKGDETVADLFCGIGTLTLPLARSARRVLGVEIVEPAIQDARNAAAENGISNAEFVCGDAGTVLERRRAKGFSPDVVVVDPPRKGLDAHLIEQIIACAPTKIGYVSCDCATLARDVRLFLDSGRYTLSNVQPLDMFPWTEHVECVALLQKNDA